MPDGAAPWLGEERAAWLASVEEWLSVALGEEPPAIDSVEERPWGAVLRVRTETRTLFFKAVGPRGRHETWLLADIADRQPRLAPDVVAVDHDAGWVLMPDHGHPMRGNVDAAGQVALVESILPAYAELQATSQDLLGRWADVGVPDRSPARLPELLDRLLAGKGACGPLPIDEPERAAYEGRLSDFRVVCDELTTTAVGEAIDHADIHGSNVLVHAGSARLVDWGDSCISHPYSSLMVPIEWVVSLLPVGQHRSATARLCDAYLQAFGARAEREALGPAVWVGYIARAMSNDEQCAGDALEHVANAQTEIVALLRTWHAKSSLLGKSDDILLPGLRW
jgi:hypothetical protein